MCPSRRHVLGAALGIPATALILSACTNQNPDETNPSVEDDVAPPSAPTVAVAQVPVGAGIVVPVAGRQVAVGQPTKGTFVAYEAVCTHQGASLIPGDDRDVLLCPLHGSTFALADGAATKGPATQSLTPVAVTVDGDNVVLG